MDSKILEYHKTEHFMLRQWERKINDQILYRVLPIASSLPQEDLVLVAESKRYDKELGEKTVTSGKYIAVVIFQKCLVTCFWCECIKKIKNRGNQIIEIK